jgi:phosphohistidine swiveling domain-containing protein
LSVFTACDIAFAQQQADNKPAVNPLVRLLQGKGILTEEEVGQINRASSPADADQQLAKLLVAKGVITQTDYDRTYGGLSTMNASATTTSNPSVISAVYRVPANSGAVALPASVGTARNAPSATAGPVPDTGPTVVPAVTPLRVFTVGGLTKGEMKPALTIGNLHVTPYGFIKATFVHDSSSPGGDDFPLPGFLGDTGPQGSPEFHVKARGTRFGANFEWMHPSPNLTVTGKIEADFEGNFSRADNRNLSSIRSSMPSIRLAYVRLDYKFGEKDTFTTVMGQDWTPFTSSTMPNLLETTILSGGYGKAWERDPQMRFGWTHNFGSFKMMPEIAAALPASGVVPGAANLANQLGYGERQGPDSARPTVEGRVAFQFQLDHAPGVAPAQIIFSGEQGERKAVVTAAAVPAAFKTAFPQGATVSSNTDGWTGEFQLPTRYMTLIGKYYSGSDLRWFFAGQFFSNYNDTFGLTGTASAASIDGASTVVFGTNASGTAVVAPQRPVRASGGFVNLGLPLSRIFGANPQGRNAGWTLNLNYGVDFAKARDVERFNPGGARHKSPLYAGTLYYKLNNWVTFAFEQSLYETNAVAGPAGELPLFRGIPSRTWRDLRSEGGTIFTF